MLDKALFCAIISVLGGGVDALAARAIPKMEFGMQEEYTIYGGFSPSGKGYVGKTRCGIKARRGEHCSAAAHGRGFLFGRALRKYGDKMEWRILARACSPSMLSWLERAYIEVLGTMSPNGYNLTGGEVGGVFAVSDETRAKLSAAGRGRVVSTETRKRISEALRGKKRTAAQCAKMSAERKGKKRKPLTAETKARIAAANRGKYISAETRAKISANHGSRRPEVRAKISAAHRGKVLSAETRAKFSLAQLGRKHTLETRDKIRAAKMGSKNPFFNKKHSCETRKKMVDAQKLRHACNREYNAILKEGVCWG